MAGVGSKAPDFAVDTVSTEGILGRRSRDDYRSQWLLLIFYPRDQSFVCPTELTAFSARIEDFQKRECALLAISVDTVQTHRDWLRAPLDRGGIGALRFPLGADPEGCAARAYGIWNEQAKLPNRGLFLIDPNGIVQYSTVHSLSVGRSVEEVLRVLDALKSGGLCPASWTRADGTLDVEGLLQAGRVLGHYRIERELGRGSFASVFSAWDLRLERWVALKVLRRARSTTDRDVLAEARSAAAINHPHVCSVYAVDEIDGLPVIIMELLEGETLAALLVARLPFDRALELGARIAEGLAAAHMQEVVHGDLKPANVLVVNVNRPVIVDFGLAHTRRSDEARELVSAAASSASAGHESGADSLEATTAFHLRTDRHGTHTIPNHLEGTPAYMAPEQAMDQPSDSASDVFALGLLLYEMCTGRRAVSGDTLSEVLQCVRDPLFGARIAAEFDGEVQALMRGMLNGEPARRPSAATVAECLDHLSR